MRIRIENSARQVEIMSWNEVPSVRRFTGLEDVVRYLRARLPGTPAAEELARRLGHSSLPVADGEALLRLAARRVLSGEWRIVEHSRKSVGVPAIIKPEAAPPSKPARESAVPVAETAGPAQCTNPACAGAFDSAAESGTPLVTADAEGC